MRAWGLDVVCLDELRATRLTTQAFVRQAGFDLAEFWAHHLET